MRGSVGEAIARSNSAKCAMRRFVAASRDFEDLSRLITTVTEPTLTSTRLPMIRDSILGSQGASEK